MSSVGTQNVKVVTVVRARINIGNKRVPPGREVIVGSECNNGTIARDICDRSKNTLVQIKHVVGDREAITRNTDCSTGHGQITTDRNITIYVERSKIRANFKSGRSV